MTLRRIYDTGTAELLVTIDGNYVEVALRPTPHNRWSAPLRCQHVEDDAPTEDIACLLATYDPDTSGGHVPQMALAEINRLRQYIAGLESQLRQANAVAVHYEAWFGDECRCCSDDCPLVEWNA